MRLSAKICCVSDVLQSLSSPTDCRGIVLDGDNGFLVPVRDAQALAVALRRLIENAALRTEMGRRGREIVLAEFSQERIITEILAVYQELA